MSKYDEKQKEYTERYLKTLRYINFRVKPEEYERYENAAKRAGYKSMRQFYMAAIEDMIQKIDREFPE